MNEMMLDRFVLKIQRRTTINAPAAVVFESILEQLGPDCTMPGDVAFPMTLEAWPGGRWFRETGKGAGHWWATVQVIKPPTLLELAGPIFMSYAVASHVQYRIAAEGNRSQLTVTHNAIGDISPEHRHGVGMGWDYILSSIVKRASARV